MRKIRTIALALLVTGVCFIPAAFAAEKGDRFKASIESANRYIGMSVRDRQGQQLGEIRDVLLDVERGRIAYLVIASGGVFGIGDSNHIVPWKAVSPRPEENFVTLNLGKDRLEKAPKRTAEMSDQDFHRELHSFYGVSPYWENSAEAERPNQRQEESRNRQAPKD